MSSGNYNSGAGHPPFIDPATAVSGGASEPGTVREMGERIRETAEDTLRRVQEAAPEYYEQGREKLSEITAEVEDYIRREPLKAALIAAGVGLCVGLCLMRR